MSVSVVVPFTLSVLLMAAGLGAASRATSRWFRVAAVLFALAVAIACPLAVLRPGSGTRCLAAFMVLLVAPSAWRSWRMARWAPR